MNHNSNHSVQYLNSIHSPADFKRIPSEELPLLTEEIRSELIRITSQNGGHLASNLGVVELTMALHRCFDTPKDHIIFDVGHQSYVHKMLTGRYGQMESIRLSGGISGFTNRSESEHDCFGAGHSSTSLSAALGFAISDKLQGNDAYTIAVIGDGAYTGGMIHEALNNCRKDLRLIIVMNENEMSISKNIGRFAKQLAKLRTKSGYFTTKRVTGGFLRKLPLIGKPLFRLVRGVKKSVKNVLYGSNYFENMGLTYLGPIDGNNYLAVENLLNEAKKLNESVVVHLKTKKGKGFSPAENAPDLYHGMTPGSTPTDEKKNFSKEMGAILTEMATEDPRICAITAAMCDGTGLCSFREAFPDRFFDVGIAEEHALTFAAGLASNGMKPYTAIYSTFLQRGYDNLIHDIALQKLPCVICVDRAGLNPGDGSTHHGIFDVAFLSQIPNLRIYTPITVKSLKKAMYLTKDAECPIAIRYPNGYENEEILKEFHPVYLKDDEYSFISRNFTEQDPIDVIIITHGRIVAEACVSAKKLKADGYSVGIVLLEMLKPYEEIASAINCILPKDVGGLLFLEEEIKSGGMGMNLSEQMRTLGYLKDRSFEILATDDNFVENRLAGQHIYDAAGVSASHIEHACLRLINK